MQKYGENMISLIIGAVIFVVVFVALVPTVANSQVAATNNANVTGAAASLTGLITLLFVAMGIIAMFRFIG
jgi:uncharacterized membrane protein